MSEGSISKPIVNQDGSIRLTFAKVPMLLSQQQVKILYALAESDWGALSRETLQKILSQEERSGDTLATPRRKGSLEETLRELRLLGLVHQDDAISQPKTGVVRQSELALSLITWLTRDWPEWPEYSRQISFDPY